MAVRREFNQFFMMMYKSFLLRRRHWFVTGVELLIPILLAIVPVLLLNTLGSRAGPSSGKVNSTYYDPFSPFSTTSSVKWFLYTPKNDVTEKLMNESVKLWASKVRASTPNVRWMPSEEAMEEYAGHLQNKYEPVMGTVFKNMDHVAKLPDSLQYAIRYGEKYGYDFYTTSKFPTSNAPRRFDAYKDTSFLSWQAAVEQTFIRMSAKQPESVNYEVIMQRFPFPPYQQNAFVSGFLSMVQSVVLYLFVILICIHVKRIVEEKANHSKEFLRMMGMSSCIYWTSSFCSIFITGFISSVVTVIMFSIPVNSSDGSQDAFSSVLGRADGFLFFVILLLYLAGNILMAMALCTFFNRPNLAISAFLVVYMVPYNVLFALVFFGDSKYIAVTQAAKLAICLYPNGALSVVYKLMAAFEQKGEGMTWGNLGAYPSTENVNVAQVMAVMLVSLVLYSIVIWYVDAVWPWQDGVPKPLYFPFTKSYWCGYSASSDKDFDSGPMDDNRNYFELEPVGSSPGIVLRNLKKVFRVGFHTKTVVDDLSLNIYHGQITALLGQNGAGKTTTINMLTGLYVPDGGSAFIHGFDIHTQTQRARESLGICPQENIQYDTLNVKEHLEFYAGIKGVPFSQTTSAATKTMSLVGLVPAAQTLSRNLSGGLKRKLSLAMAIVGDSKVLFLDEPTSGMDPENRHKLWDILLGLREDRTIVLTTHYMEEADVLGDRIAIMASGKLRCCGSPIFLKRQFGAGYMLHIAKNPECMPDKVTAFLQNYIPECSLEDVTETELTYSFPSETTGSVFGKMFSELEKNVQELAVASFGMTVTTMDDVFVKVSSLDDDTLQGKNGFPKDSANGSETGDGSLLLQKVRAPTGAGRMVSSFTGLFVKRFCYAKRHYSILVNHLVFPFLFMLLLAYLVKSPDSSKPKVSTLYLNLKSVYGSTLGFYSYNSSASFIKDFYVPVLRENGVDVTEESDPNSYILNEAEKQFYKYLVEFIAGGSSFSSNNTSLKLMAWYNGQPFHSMPISLNLMHTALLRHYSSNPHAALSLTNAPLPAASESSYSTVQVTLVYLVASLLLPGTLCWFTGVYMVVPILERVTRAKLLQLLTGLDVLGYWCGMFLWDMLVHCAVSVILLLPFAIFNADVVFARSDSAGSIFLLLLLYGWCCIWMCYLLSLFFKNSNTASTVLTSVNLVLAMIFVSVLMQFYQNVRGLVVAVWFLRFIPTFSVTWGLTKVLMESFNNTLCQRIPKHVLDSLCSVSYPGSEIARCCGAPCNTTGCPSVHPLSWGNERGGCDAFMLAAVGCIYMGLLLFAESSLLPRIVHAVQRAFGRIKQPIAALPEACGLQEDPSVTNEAQRVSGLGPAAAGNEALCIIGLTKHYGTLCAVDNLTFAVHKEECFGLLGVNGAGKTSTFKMLTGDIIPTKGDAYIGQFSLNTSLKQFQSCLGYCPQYDPLLDRLTGREMLNLFASLRGIPNNDAAKVVPDLIKSAGLEEHADKQTKLYSGGNKRKLSLAMAVLGAPQVILLDEPTSGVDPVSRRKIWKILSQVQEESGSSVVLCTHSMEECEVLCNRLAIMVNGQFRCLGSIQQLKATFGQGYTVIIKPKRETASSTEALNRVISRFRDIFPGSVLRDNNQGILQFQVTDTSVQWSKLFTSMEEMKNEFSLEDYLISGTALEQIFLAFARSQRASAEHV